MVTREKIKQAIKETESLLDEYPYSSQAGMAVRAFLEYIKFLDSSSVILWTSPLAHPAIINLLVVLAHEQERLLHVVFRMRN